MSIRDSVGWDCGGGDRDTDSRSTALKLHLMDAELTALWAFAFGELHFDRFCSTTLIICNSCTRSSTFLRLLASRAIRHTKVELDVRFLVDRDIKLSNGERLVTTDFIAEVVITQIRFNAFAL